MPAVRSAHSGTNDLGATLDAYVESSLPTSSSGALKVVVRDKDGVAVVAEYTLVASGVLAVSIWLSPTQRWLLSYTIAPNTLKRKQSLSSEPGVNDWVQLL